jgi:hypothetical protein
MEMGAGQQAWRQRCYVQVGPYCRCCSLQRISRLGGTGGCKVAKHCCQQADAILGQDRWVGSSGKMGQGGVLLRSHCMGQPAAAHCP